jgi:hypothetical protein
MTPSSFSVTIPTPEAIVRLAPRENYRIRVVPVRVDSGEKFAIAAVRCESPRNVEFLSQVLCTPLEAVRSMQNGFTLLAHASERARAIVAALVGTPLAS